ncbi:MAG: hypothetical protein R3351_04580 [Nitrospirales bacterium]|nr:hypothetical protein [Nitrospirales bacterium]
MRHLRLVSAILVLLGLTGVGCQRDLYNVKDAPVPTFGSRSLTMEEVKNAIMKSRGTSQIQYQMRDVQPGLIRCVITHKIHRAVVNITYSTESYSITYQDSQNLKYEPADAENAAVIHRHYNTWIRDLDESIRFNLSSASGEA